MENRAGRGAGAVADSIAYGLKKSAVLSENTLSNIKASNGNLFSVTSGSSSTEIRFVIPAISGGHYIDASNSRFSVKFSLDNSTLTNAVNYSLDHGPLSLVRRMQIYDASNHLLEDVEHVESLARLQTACTVSQETLTTRLRFNKHGRTNEYGT